MANIESEHVKAAWKYICQLRAQIDKGRASLVLGSGICIDLKLPNWDDLLKEIKKTISAKAPGAYSVSDPPGKAALVLFEMFCSYRKSEIAALREYDNSFLVEKKILSEWREMIHNALYKGTTEHNRRQRIDSHPYFRCLLEFVKLSEITITYNFDDYIEFGLSQKDINPSPEERPYQTIWSHQSQFTKDKCVIYHPNGFLPLDNKKFQSENLIFSDGSFADQLLDGINGNFSTILHVLTKKTSVLIGHSLTDSTLLHLLRKAASISPGNYNYFIRYTENPDKLENKSAIFEANFNNYNLITLFFNNDDVNEFLQAVTMPETEFRDTSDVIGMPTKYIYYLVGAIGIGKSTALSQFGSLTTLDEWFDERPSDMALSPDNIPDEKIAGIDLWTNSQFGKKNNFLLRSKVGVFLVDRSPLDPLSFAVNVPESSRAKSMLENGIRPGRSTKEVARGEIIHMSGDAKEIWSRLITKRKEANWPLDKVDKLQKKSESLYKNLQPNMIYATQRMEVEVIRDIAKVIFSSSYAPVDIDAELQRIANEK